MTRFARPVRAFVVLLAALATALAATVPAAAAPAKKPPLDVVSVGAGPHVSIAIGADGRMYGWGNNQYGYLADGSGTQRFAPVRSTSALKFSQVIGGGVHMLGLTTKSVVYAWGWNWHGQLGVEDRGVKIKPVKVRLPANVKFTQVAAGSGHSLAVSKNGDVYAWGENSDGQIGDGTEDKDAWAPIKINGGEAAGVKFVAVAAGQEFSLALDNHGIVYGWGYNDTGTLGMKDNRPRVLPEQANMPQGVKFSQIAAGGYHALALTTGGALYTWGLNDRGQRGLDTSKSQSLAMTPVAVGKKFTKIAAGERFSVALGTDGKVYVWGSYEPLTIDGYTTKPILTPTAIAPKGKYKKVRFVDIAAGSDHVVALGDNGRVFAWGMNRFGQLGNGKIKNSMKPVLVKNGAIPKATGKAKK